MCNLLCKFGALQLCTIESLVNFTSEVKKLLYRTFALFTLAICSDPDGHTDSDPPRDMTVWNPLPPFGLCQEVGEDIHRLESNPSKPTGSQSIPPLPPFRITPGDLEDCRVCDRECKVELHSIELSLLF